MGVEPLEVSRAQDRERVIDRIWESERLMTELLCLVFLAGSKWMRCSSLPDKAAGQGTRAPGA